MTTAIRPEISTRNKYYIDKHRHYELKHFCLQYPKWKRAYIDLTSLSASLSQLENTSKTNIPGNPTAKCAIRKSYYSERIKLLENIAKEADEYLWYYILRAVTEGLSFAYLKTKMDIPCGKDMYYDRYRKFFWLLSEARN